MGGGGKEGTTSGAGGELTTAGGGEEALTGGCDGTANAGEHKQVAGK
jgi:hypothetical protein